MTGAGTGPVQATRIERTLSHVFSPWRVNRTLLGFPALIVVELRAGDELAYWFLDRSGEFLANEYRDLPGHHRALVAEMMAYAAQAPDRADARAFRSEYASLSRALRRQLMRGLLDMPGQDRAALVTPRWARNETDDERIQVVDDQHGHDIRIDGYLEFPISMAGRESSGFVAGWRAVFCSTLLAPLLMLDLRHDQSGAEATWILDENFHRIDDENLSTPAVQAIIRRRAPPVLRRFLRGILACEDLSPARGPVDDATRLLLRAGTGIRYRIGRLCHDLVFPYADNVPLSRCTEQLWVGAPADGRDDRTMLGIDGEALARAVGGDLVQRATDAIRTGRFSWPALTGPGEAELEGVLIPQEYTIFYQFRDPGGLRFLVASGDRHCRLMGLLIPEAGLVIYPDGSHPPDHWFSAQAGGTIYRVLLDHCLIHAATLSRRGRRGDARIVNVFALRLLHIGHYVWNDLSGIVELQRRLGADVPDCVVIDGANGGNELFGPLDGLLPGLDGRVKRDLRDHHAFADWCYEGGVIPVRMTGSRVSRPQREAVRRWIETTAEYAEVRTVLEGLPAGAPRIVVGLRVEDRTLVDLEGFFGAILEKLSDRHPGAVVVFDSRNARFGSERPLASIADAHAVRSPIDIELALVAALRDRMNGRPVEIFSTIGRTVYASMSWCYAADLCLAIWGAGLAKYRWLANLPAVVISSRFNVEHRDDFDIYHSPRVMDDPAPMLVPAAELVTDVADHQALMPEQMSAGRRCFDIDPDTVFGLVERLIAARPAERRAVTAAPSIAP